MKRTKQFLAIFLSAMMVTLFLSGFTYTKAHADVAATDATSSGITAPDASTRVLSGTISENLDLGPEATNIILSGVTVNNDARIRINADQAIVTLADGTDNKIAALEAMGSLEFQGAGNLEATSIFAMEGISFNGTGNYSLPNGGIFNFSGEVTFNSGNFTISTGSSEMGYAITSGSGNISLNGANLDLHGRVSALHSSGTLVLAGGSLKATSVEDPAVTSGYKLSDGITVGPSMVLDFGLKPGDLPVEGGTVVTALVNHEGKGVTSVSAHGNPVAPGSVAAQETTTVPYDSDYVNSIFSSSQSESPVDIMVIIAVVLCIAALASAVILAVRHRRTSKHDDSNGTASSNRAKKALKSTSTKTICIVLAISLALPCSFVAVSSAHASEAQATATQQSTQATATQQATAQATQAATQSATTADTSATAQATVVNNKFATGAVNDDYAKWEYYYSDDYFTHPSTNYNESLATLSLSMARSAFGVINGNDFSHGDQNIRAFMTNNGFSNISSNEFMNKEPTTETIGVTVGSKSIIDSDGKKSTLIALAVRGGNYEAEWGSNVKMGVTGEAEGFAQARDLVVEHLNKYLVSHSSDFNSRLKIWISGFSRAAAVSNLTGNFLNCAAQGTGQKTQLMQATRSALSSYSLHSGDIFCYTFETPKGGHDSTIYNYCDNTNLFNLINPVDPVTYVAPSDFGFKRYGIEIDITKNIDFNKVLDNANNLAGGTVPYGYAQEVQGETQFYPYKYNGMTDALCKFLRNGIGSIFSKTSKPLTDGVFETYRTSFNNAVFSNRADYNEKLFSLMCNSGSSRENYATNLQSIVSLFAEKLMGGSSANKDKFMDTLLNGVNDNMNYFELAMLTVEVIRPKIAIELVGAGFLTGVKLSQDNVGGFLSGIAGGIASGLTAVAGGSVWSVWRAKIWAQDGFISGEHSLKVRIEKALKGGLKNAHDKGSITDQQYNDSDRCTEGLTLFIINFLKNDEKCDFQFTMTTVKYGSYLFNPHFPVVSMEYLMADDSNYDAAHNISIRGWNGRLPMGTKAKVYSVDENGNKTQIALIDNDRLLGVDGGSAPDYLTLLGVQNGYVIRSAYDKANSTSNAGIAVDIMSSSSIMVDYSNHGNGQKGFANCTDYFEQTEIPMGIGDTVSLTVKNSSPKAEFKKTLTPQFIYGTIDEDTGKISESKPATNIFINSLRASVDDQGAVLSPLKAEGTYSFMTDDAMGGYLTASKVYRAKRTSKGSIQVDKQTGQPNMTCIESNRETYPAQQPQGGNISDQTDKEYAKLPTVSWTESFDVSSTSPIYFIESAVEENSLKVKAKGILNNANGSTENMPSGTFSLSNLTTGEKSSGTTLKANPNDIICAKVENSSDQNVFMRWSIGAGEQALEMNEGSPLSNEFKFIMPCRDVKLNAMFFNREKRDDTLAVFNGTWAYNCTSAVSANAASTGANTVVITGEDAADGAKLTTPADNGWTQQLSEAKSGQTSFLTSGSHVLKMEQGDQSGKYLFIQAPKTIEVAGSEDYSFDHWEAKYIDSGRPVTDAIARQLSLAYTADGEFASATFATEGDAGLCSPHGSTSPVLCISNSKMKESIFFEPVYSTKQYSYTFTLTNWKQVSGTAKPGQVIKVQDKETDGKIFKNWEVNCNSMTYATNPDGTLSQIISTGKMDIANADNQTLTFVMPHGDVWGNTVYAAEKYFLSAMEYVKAYAGSIEDGKVTTIGEPRYYFEAGETVFLYVNINDDEEVIGWRGASKDMNMRLVRNDKGEDECYKFTMPDHNVSLIPYIQVKRTAQAA